MGNENIENKELVICYNCNNGFEDTIEFGGNDYCKDCLDEITIICDDCGDRCYFEDSLRTIDSVVCPDCSSNYTNCCECDEMIHNNYIFSFDGYEYCEGCLEDITTICDNCGDRFHNDDVDSSGYCEECCSEMCYNDIGVFVLDNKNKPSLIPDGVKIGIEIERFTCDLKELKTKINEDKQFKGEVCVDTDGSLDDCGREFKSPILTNTSLKYWINNYVSYFNKIGQDHNKAGLHVHISWEDGRHFSIQNQKKIFMMYDAFYNSLMSLAKKERMTNSFCAPFKYSFYASSTRDKYRFVSFTHCEQRRKGTIELRYMNSGIGPIQLQQFIRFHVALMEKAMSMHPKDFKRLKAENKDSLVKLFNDYFVKSYISRKIKTDNTNYSTKKSFDTALEYLDKNFKEFNMVERHFSNVDMKIISLKKGTELSYEQLMGILMEHRGEKIELNVVENYSGKKNYIVNIGGKDYLFKQSSKNNLLNYFEYRRHNDEWYLYKYSSDVRYVVNEIMGDDWKVYVL